MLKKLFVIVIVICDIILYTNFQDPLTGKYKSEFETPSQLKFQVGGEPSDDPQVDTKSQLMTPRWIHRASWWTPGRYTEPADDPQVDTHSQLMTPGRYKEQADDPQVDTQSQLMTPR